MVPGGASVVSRADELRANEVRADALRDRIRALVGEYYHEAFPARAFVPGSSPVPISGRVFDEQELNLLAVAALTSQKLGDRRLRPGDEVITLAAGFPTTVNPILQNGLVPVFVDVSLPTFNVDVSYLETALSDRTPAVFFAHTLGNPFDLDAVTAFTKKHGLWLIEDCCDALGSTYRGEKVGTFGDL